LDPRSNESFDIEVYRFGTGKRDDRKTQKRARNVTYARRSIEENSVPRSHSAVWCCVFLVLVLESCSRAKDRRAANSQRDTKIKAVCFSSRHRARTQPADSSAIVGRGDEFSNIYLDRHTHARASRRVTRIELTSYTRPRVRSPSLQSISSHRRREVYVWSERNHRIYWYSQLLLEAGSNQRRCLPIAPGQMHLFVNYRFADWTASRSLVIPSSS